MKIICNSSTLIALQKINKIEILQDICDEIIIPKEVQEEVFQNNMLPSFLKVEKINDLLAFEILNENLGKGESACIVLANEIESDLIILDDLKARKIAENHDLRITGLIGILIKAKGLNIIDSVENLVNELIRNDFRVSKNIINYILDNKL